MLFVFKHKSNGGTSFNGSTVREPWLCTALMYAAISTVNASMGPRSENRGYAGKGCLPGPAENASMGPRSENRGYATSPTLFSPPSRGFNGSTVREPWLCPQALSPRAPPQCFNGSTVREPWLCLHAGQSRRTAAHGFNGSTVREPWLCTPTAPAPPEYVTVASMGPRSENRGYDDGKQISLAEREASMGPRSENRGYERATEDYRRGAGGFNGSTVREPWLCSRLTGSAYRLRGPLQWVHGPRTVVMPAARSVPRPPSCPLQWVHGPRTVVMAPAVLTRGHGV